MEREKAERKLDKKMLDNEKEKNKRLESKSEGGSGKAT